MKKDFMRLAVQNAHLGLRKNEGGPFGAVIVQNGKVIARAHNRVIKTKDPTAHAEILAIRMASKKLNRFDLSDCEIYSTCEPCPMCLGAILWAGIKRLYYGCAREDASKIGFGDKMFYDIIKGASIKHQPGSTQIGRELCLELFNEWENKKDKVCY